MIYTHILGPDKMGPRHADILGEHDGYILYHRLDIKCRRDGDGHETPHRFRLPTEAFFQRYVR